MRDGVEDRDERDSRRGRLLIRAFEDEKRGGKIATDHRSIILLRRALTTLSYARMLPLIATSVAQLMPDGRLLIQHMIRQIKDYLIGQALTVLFEQKLRVVAALATVVHQIVVEPHDGSLDIVMDGIGHAVQLQILMR